NSSMRKAQLKIADPQGKEPGEVVFYHFGQGNGGGTKANIDRWLSQFQEPKDKIQSKIEEATVHSHKVTFVQAQGTYLSGMPGGPKTPQLNTMLMAAILESDQGNVFVRLTGPINLVQAAQATFRKMITSSTTGP